ncbi:armadillo-type protein [Chytridium lagenaria]|nr:armadillo-type protein [Chytridium lagenaria]
MGFVQWVARMGKSEKIKPVAGILLSGLLKFIDENQQDRSQEGESIRGFAYEAVGLISKKAPDAVSQDLSILKGFFTAISDESRTSRFLCRKRSRLWLKRSPEPQARLVAVKYARALFPFSHALSRYVCIVASADPKIEVREEGRRGLDFPVAPVIAKFTGLTGEEEEAFEKYRTKLPNLGETLQVLSDMGKKPRPGARLPGVRYVGSYTAEGYTSAVEFARRLFVLTAYPSARISDIRHPSHFGYITRKAYKAYLAEVWGREKGNENGVIGLYVSLVEGALKEQESDALLLSVASSCLLELISLGPSATETRVLVWRGFWELSATCNADGVRLDAIVKLIEELNTTIADQSRADVTLELRHGSILALGYLLGRLYYRFPDRVVNAALHAKSIKTLLEALNRQIGRYGLLVPEADVNAMDVDDAVKSEGVAEAILKKLEEFSGQTKDGKLQESAITALGHMGKRIVDFMFTLPSLLGKHMSLDEYLDIADVVFPPPGSTVFAASEELIEEVVKKALKDVSPVAAAVSRKGVCIWLLSFVKFCGTHGVVVKHLPEIHQAFSKVASKGIGLVYELGDGRIKSSLVESLVSTISEGRRLAPQSVTNDTQIFQEGALGATPDGGSLTTYQSILSLASDMNQPDLVYKFMSLASHNAIWNSRRGASMGFSTIAAYAEKELAPHLAFLVPKLFRFQFDPNVKVAESMKSIWRSLVKEPKKTVDEYFEAILVDVASCLALADLLHGREIVCVEKRLEEIWSVCFARLDDIKESVRAAAFSTCKTLTGMTVKYCDAEVVSVKEGQKITDIVVPLFLKKGLPSSAEDKGGVLLKPHITDVVTTLLEGLSSMEPQVMNYLTFHIDKYNITQEQLDTSRLSAAKSSPMMEAIETCVMEDLIPSITNIARKGVGLPTKAGCARFIVSLVTKVPQDLKPHADTLLKALSGAISDRSAAIRKSYATAIGYLFKLCSQGSATKLIAHLRAMYTDGEDEDGKSMPGITFLEISKHSSDALANYFTEVLPLAFIGRKDPNENINAVWALVWEENTASGMTSAVKLYMTELVAVCANLLGTNPSWSIKKQVGAAIGDMAKAVGEDVEGNVGTLGKEAVLEGLLEVTIAGKKYFGKAENRKKPKRTALYKKFSIEYLGKFFDAHGLNRFEELEEYLFEVAERDEMDEDTDVDDGKLKPLVLVIRANAFRAIGKVFTTEKATQDKRLQPVLAQLTKNLEGSIWNVKLAILDALESILEKADANLLGEEALRTATSGLFSALGDLKVCFSRYRRAKVLKSLLRKVKDLKAFASIKNDVITSLDEAIAKEPMTTISEPLKEFRKEISGMDIN